MNAISDAAWQREQSRLRPTVLRPDTVNWESVRPDPQLMWVPEELTPLAGTEAYKRLSVDQRLRYNQFYGQQLVEEFAWIETHLISAPLRKLSQSADDGSAQAQVLESFVADEVHHVACFTALRDTAASVTGIREPLFTPPLSVRWLARAAAAAPVALPFWVEAIQVFETYALAIGQAYRDAEDMDPLFRDVFIQHARDEARHCQYDDLLYDWLVGGQAAWRKSFSNALHKLFVKRYYDVFWGLDGPIRALCDGIPELDGSAGQLIQEVRQVRLSGGHIIQTFS